MADEIRVITVCVGNTAQWAAAVRPLEAGELGYDTDTNELKVGDGATAFPSLPRLNGLFAKVRCGDTAIG
jgi:hypothetical protein